MRVFVQAVSIEQPIEAVNKITGRKFDKHVLKKTGEKTCYSCGYSGRYASNIYYKFIIS
jgi:hypothetical protein